MSRRIWIIPKKDVIEQSDIDNAKLNGCPEIANGIPLALQDIISEGLLPSVYDEPEPPIPDPPRSTHISTLVSVDVNKARPANIKRVWNGNDYFYDCFVTQAVKDEYQAGNIAIGDYLLVHFDEVGEQVVTDKVFKSW